MPSRQNTMRRKVRHEQIRPLASSARKSIQVGDAHRPVLDRIVYLFPLYYLVFLLVPKLILINIKRLQKQLWELNGVEILAAGVVLLQFLQFILHHLRFRRRHWLVQWGAWAAYYVPVPLAALAVGMMLRLGQPFWAVAILFAAAQSDTMAAYSLDDDSQNMRRFAKRTLYIAYLIVALLQVAPTELYPLLAASFLVLFVHLKVGSMAMVPSGDICMVAAEAISRTPSTSSQGQGAVVTVGSLESRWSAISGSTTYEDILALDYSAKLKDICLSSALFLQLLQRYHTPNQCVDTWSSANLAFKELLAGEDRGYARALKLVEVQLSFMYDHFFSAHGSPSSASYKLYWDHWVFKIGFLMHILSLVYLKAVEQAEHITFAIGVIYLLVMLELCQLAHYLTSDRFVVSYMCDRARVLSRHRSPGKALHIVVLNAILETRGTRWQNTTLGQYSLVEDFDCTSLGQRLMGRLLHGRPQRRTYASPVALSMDEVKAWILGKVVTPEHSGTSSTASESHASSPSQRRTAFPHQLSWTFSQETEIHTILIWHIATWLCATQDVKKVPPSSESDYMAATKFSSYCVYLVAFHPEFLPGHHTVARRIFDEAVREAELHLKGEKSSYGRYTIFKSAWERKKLSTLGVLAQGATLAEQLTRMDKHGSSCCWSIVADFWGEMLLHLALSGNAIAHIEHLAKGGEFVTHLWALLSNAGMQQDNTLIKRNMIDFSKVKSKLIVYMEHEETGCRQPQDPIQGINNCGFFGSAATTVNDGYGGKGPVTAEVAQVEEKTIVVKPPVVAETSEPAAVIPKAKEGPDRCTTCRKQVGLTGFRYRCGAKYCAKHRDNHKHFCLLDGLQLGM